MFYDVGAAIGWYSVIAALKVGKTGRVISCEPERGNYRLLCLNIKQNRLDNVTALRCAVSDRSGWGRLYRSTENLGDHRLDVRMENGSSERTRTVTLLDLIGHGYPPPDVMKIDTQGCEAKILSCLPELCKLNPKLSVVLEFWPFGLEQCGTSYKQLLQTLEGLDLEFFVLCELPRGLAATTLSQIARRCESDLHPSTNEFVNLVALPRPRADYLPAPEVYVDQCLQLAASWNAEPTLISASRSSRLARSLKRRSTRPPSRLE